MTRSTPLVAVALAIGASLVVGIAWFGLSMATGLLYHLMPGATFLVTGWVFRDRVDRPASRNEGALLLAIAGAVTVLGLVLIPAAGGLVGGSLENLVVVAGGFILAARWMLRPRVTEGPDTRGGG